MTAGPNDLPPAVAEFGSFISSTARSYSSDEIRSPVTFGVQRPVVLLPSRFGELATDVQRAVICHELLHVQRRDWLFTIAEEVVRAVLWFHPAIWWLISQIQLTREQVVDREVLDLAPAPLFLKKRHLNQRVEALLQERTMSKQRIVVCMTMLAAAVVGASWIAVGTFPLAAAPAPQAREAISRPAVEIAEDEPLLHRTAPKYPRAASEERIEGQVDLEVSIDGRGNVYDARVLNGPEELRSTALRTVWNGTTRKKFLGPRSGSLRLTFISLRPVSCRRARDPNLRREIT